MPGGGGNWGGSFLAVPKQSKHPKEAAELVEFLTSAGGPDRGLQGRWQPAVLAAGAATTRRCRPRPTSTSPTLRPARSSAPARGAEAGLPRPEEPGGPRRGGERSPRASSRASSSPTRPGRRRQDAKQGRRVRSRDRRVAPAASRAPRAAPDPAAAGRSEDRRRSDERTPRWPGRRRPRRPRADRRRRAARSRRGARWPDRLKFSPVPLHRAVLPALRRSSALYPLVYTVWVSLHDWELHRRHQSSSAWTTTASCSATTQFWNAVVQHRRHLRVATVPQLLLALLLANVLNRQSAGAHAVPDGRAHAEHHLGRRGRRSSSPSSSAATSAWSTGCSTWSASTRSTGRRASGRSWIAISTMVDWRWTGYNALIFLAAMQAIPRTSTRRRRSTAPAAGGSSGDHGPAAPADDHLHGDHLHHRRACSSSPSRCCSTAAAADPGGSLRQSQTMTMFLYERRVPAAFRLRLRLGGRLAALRADHRLRADQLPVRPPARSDK